MLPGCLGLHPFEDPQSEIKWIQRLDEDREGNQVFVFKVEIVLIVQFTNPKDHRYYWQSRLRNELSLKEALYDTDPFYAECRAYGRIREGFMPRLVRWLERAGVDLEVDVLDHELHEALAGYTRIRAIEKHFERDPKEINARNIHRALRSADNFIAHRLVDFGSSWTEPHVFLEYFEEGNLRMAGGWRLKDKIKLRR
ncbi:hypothetical protein F5B21DRAFT_517740 [Xylaria acuta]|nr:hypothetical protein F5B21DRAFT_517740 [Xylaria acuta]